MSATASCPLPWKAAAAITRIAPLMNKADISATDESMVAKRIASALLGTLSRYLRVCTIDECRYRLCGITVAPRMLIAMYSMFGSVRMRVCDQNPSESLLRPGLASHNSTTHEPAIRQINAT